MKNTQPSEISPLIERWHPGASLAEKKEYTEDLRRFVSALYDLHDKFRGIDARAASDSLESETHGMLESDNSPSV